MAFKNKLYDSVSQAIANRKNSPPRDMTKIELKLGLQGETLPVVDDMPESARLQNNFEKYIARGSNSNKKKANKDAFRATSQPPVASFSSTQIPFGATSSFNGSQTMYNAQRTSS